MKRKRWHRTRSVRRLPVLVSVANCLDDVVHGLQIVFGLLSLALIYPSLFFFLWALLYLSPPGFLVAALTLSGFTVYHTRLIDDNYTQ